MRSVIFTWENVKAQQTVDFVTQHHDVVFSAYSREFLKFRFRIQREIETCYERFSAKICLHVKICRHGMHTLFLVQFQGGKKW